MNFNSKPVKRPKQEDIASLDETKDAFARALNKTVENNERRTIGMKMSQKQTLKKTDADQDQDQETSLLNDNSEIEGFVLNTEGLNKPTTYWPSASRDMPSAIRLRNIIPANDRNIPPYIQYEICDVPIYVYDTEAVDFITVTDLPVPQLDRVPFVYNFSRRKNVAEFPLVTPFKNIFGTYLPFHANVERIALKTLSTTNFSDIIPDLNQPGLPVVEYNLIGSNLARSSCASVFFEHLVNQLNRMAWLALASSNSVIKDEEIKLFALGPSSFSPSNLFNIPTNSTPDATAVSAAKVFIEEIVHSFAIVDQARQKWGRVLEQIDLQVIPQVGFKDFDQAVSMIHARIMKEMRAKMEEAISGPQPQGNIGAPMPSPGMSPVRNPVVAAAVAAARAAAVPPTPFTPGRLNQTRAAPPGQPATMRLSEAMLNTLETAISSHVLTVLSESLSEIWQNYNEKSVQLNSFKKEHGLSVLEDMRMAKEAHLKSIRGYITGNPYRHYLIFSLIMQVSAYCNNGNYNAYSTIDLPEKIYQGLFKSGNLGKVLVSRNHDDRNSRLRDFLFLYDEYLDVKYMEVTSNFYGNLKQVATEQFIVAIDIVYSDIQDYVQSLQKEDKAGGMDFLFSEKAVLNGSLGILANVISRVLVLHEPGFANDLRPAHRTKNLESVLENAWFRLSLCIENNNLLD